MSEPKDTQQQPPHDWSADQVSATNNLANATRELAKAIVSIGTIVGGLAQELESNRKGQKI